MDLDPLKYKDARPAARWFRREQRAESRTPGQDDGELRCRWAAAGAGGDAAPARQFCHVAQRDPTTTVARAKLM